MKKYQSFLMMLLIICLLVLSACNGGKSENSNDDIQKNENPVTTLAVGDIVVFGKYEQDNNPDNGTEPIEWIVLDTKDNQVWLLSRYGLDAKPFGTGVFASDWEDSSLREWLNNDFYNQAFSDEEKESIRESVVLNNENHIKKETRNKVFVLSREEMNLRKQTAELLSLSILMNTITMGIPITMVAVPPAVGNDQNTIPVLKCSSLRHENTIPPFRSA